MFKNKKGFLGAFFVLLLFSASFSFAQGTKRYPIQIYQDITKKSLYPGEQAKCTFTLVNLKDEVIIPTKAELYFITDGLEFIADFTQILPSEAAKCLHLNKKKIICTEITIDANSKTQIEFGVVMRDNKSFPQIEMRMDFRQKRTNKNSYSYKDRREKVMSVDRTNPVIRTFSYFSSQHSYGKPIGTYNVDVRNYSAINFSPQNSRLEIKTNNLKIKQETFKMHSVLFDPLCSISPKKDKLICTNINLAALKGFSIRFEVEVEEGKQRGDLKGEIKLNSREFDYKYKNSWRNFLKSR